MNGNHGDPSHLDDTFVRPFCAQEVFSYGLKLVEPVDVSQLSKADARGYIECKFGGWGTQDATGTVTVIDGKGRIDLSMLIRGVLGDGATIDNFAVGDDFVATFDVVDRPC